MALRHIVTRRNWRRAADRWVRLPGDTFVCGNWSSHDAEQARGRGDAAVWSRTGNPFAAVGSVAALTTLPEFALADFLMERGLSPPSARADGTRNWSAWWADRHKFWTDAQVAALRAALDRFRFFDTEARPLDRTAVVAVRPVWEVVEDPYAVREGWTVTVGEGPWGPPDPPGFYPGHDGGRPDRAFRELEDAVAYRALVEEERRYVRPSEAVLSGPPRRWLPDDRYWARRAWYDPANTVLDWTARVAVRAEEVPPVQLYEVEYDESGGPTGSTAYLVYRTGWGPIRYFHPRVEVAVEDAVTEPDGYVESRLVPVAVCTARPRAEARAAELEGRDRGAFNPLRFVPHARGGSRPSTERLRQRLRAAGFLPDSDSERLVSWTHYGRLQELADWWHATAPDWPPDVRAEAWDALDGPAFYGVELIDFEG